MQCADSAKLILYACNTVVRFRSAGACMIAEAGRIGWASTLPVFRIAFIQQASRSKLGNQIVILEQL